MDPSKVMTFTVEAINLYDSINIKGIRSLLSGKVLDSSPQELQLEYAENSFLFVFRFGCLVFFNISEELKQKEIAKLRAALGAGLSSPTTETYQVILGDQQMKVEFEYVELKKITIDHLKLMAVAVGQSAALEYFENQTERMLNDTSSFLHRLSVAGALPFIRSHKLLRIIGSTASTRQHIISNLAILDPPDSTWKSKELEKFHFEVQENFDIGMRFKSLDRKLSLIQENIEILADLTSSRRNTWLEASVVALIIAEIVLALIQRSH